MKDLYFTGTMIACLKQVCTADWLRVRLIIEVNISISWSLHSLRTQRGMLPGPEKLSSCQPYIGTEGSRPSPRLALQ